MDSLLANYASSDEEEHVEHPPPQVILPEKQVKLAAKAEEERDKDFLPKSPPKRGGIFNSLPPPKSSLFNSLPPPKSKSFPNPMPEAELEQRREVVGERDEQILETSKPKSLSSSLFSSLPPPKSSSSSSSAKKVVQFRPPTMINPYSGSVDDEDEDSDEGEKERQMKRSKESISTSSATSFLSSIPAPRYSGTFGALPSASGMGRRSTLETVTPASTVSIGSASGSDAVVDSNAGYSKDQSGEMDYDYSGWNSESGDHAYYSGYGAVPDGNAGSAVVSVDMGSDTVVNSNVGYLGDQSHEIYDHSSSFGGESYAYYGGYGVGSAAVSSVSTAGSDAGLNSNAGSSEAVDYPYGNGQHVEYANYDGSYRDYGNNVQYENNWTNATALPEVSGVVGNELLVPGKRGRKDAPPQIVEVKQDELMKNRPREDQVKLTGIAFGPAYQPTSTKGKPTKLHKRKHQIGSLLFDMRQKEMELSERRSRGYLTKAQTQAKYGW